ncbi:MAG: ABC transporter substrate-binding protein [Acidobacteriota bacterium]|nr:ABC transporter substrate-binding protein [Acidobacteriota bacterium]
MSRSHRAGAAVFAALAIVAGCRRATADADVLSLRIGVAAPVLRESGTVGLSYTRTALSRENLLTFSDNGRPTPRVLDAWHREPDGRTWRLHVRPGILFHDGTPVTAPEIAPQIAEELAVSAPGIVKSVTAENEATLVVSLHGPYAFLLEELAFISVRRVVGNKTFGTGPYTVVEESPERILFSAVEDHYRGEPDVKQVEVKLYPDQRNAWSALMRGDLEMLYEVSRDSLEFARSESSIDVATFPRPYVYLLGLNVRHAALSNRLVRQALDRAVDREAIVRLGMAGQGEPAAGHVWPRHWAFDAAKTAPAYNPLEAVRLFEQAGLTVRREPGRMPSRLRLRCLVYGPQRQMALVLQRQLAEVDVDLELQMPDTRQMLARLLKGDFDAFVFEVASARLLKLPYMAWHSRSALIPSGYSGADDVLQQMHDAADDDVLKAVTSVFQQRVHEDPPAIFLAWGSTSRAVTRRFDIPQTSEDIFHTISRWKRATGSTN